MPHHTTNSGSTPSTTPSRRTVLRGVGAALVGTGAIATASAPVSAGKKGSCDDPPMSYPRVTTRGHFDTTWYGSVVLTDGNTATNFEYAGDGIPGVHTDPEDELLIHAHGWNNDLEGGVCSVNEAGETFAAEGYDSPVVGYTWDADFGWYNATEIAEQNGAKLAAFLTGYADANPDVTLRVCSHSLGARVALSALQSLDAWGRTDVVESTVLLGGAADDDAVSMDGQYGTSIEAATGRLDNFWMEDDDVLDWAYSTAEWDTAVGAAGVDGTPPANYTDHNVEYVPDHFSHYKEDGCLYEVVDTF